MRVRTVHQDESASTKFCLRVQGSILPDPAAVCQDAPHLSSIIEKACVHLDPAQHGEDTKVEWNPSELAVNCDAFQLERPITHDFDTKIELHLKDSFHPGQTHELAAQQRFRVGPELRQIVSEPVKSFGEIVTTIWQYISERGLLKEQKLSADEAKKDAPADAVHTHRRAHTHRRDVTDATVTTHVVRCDSALREAFSTESFPLSELRERVEKFLPVRFCDCQRQNTLLCWGRTRLACGFVVELALLLPGERGQVQRRHLQLPRLPPALRREGKAARHQHFINTLFAPNVEFDLVCSNAWVVCVCVCTGALDRPRGWHP